ncbi:hypothetical protein SASPL_145297 [Salvia splendens]|uniref:PB1-like domain-containing protein n=1 Tax=Salvia splendens TaxID=180675 RepID=A0A8X8Z793_SALSN|nr:hypothetical protein SASPL_145297 [Salvia splendens]
MSRIFGDFQSAKTSILRFARKVCTQVVDFRAKRGLSKKVEVGRVLLLVWSLLSAMSHRDDFTIQFHHGGKMVNDGGMQIYIGGDETFKSHFDADRFGYFDLIDEIKQLGYAEWSRVAFTVPKSMKKIDIKDDNNVMLMLSYLDLGICVLDVYVVGGELGEAHVADSVGGEHADDGVNETHFEEVEGSVEGEHADDGVGKDEPEGEDDGPSLEKGVEGEDEQYED